MSLLFSNLMKLIFFHLAITFIITATAVSNNNSCRSSYIASKHKKPFLITMMMKGIVQNGYGDPTKVLSIQDTLQRPIVKKDDSTQVLVKVISSTVNTPDWIRTIGKPYLLRLIMVGLFPPKNRTLGTDIAGIVEDIGDKVTEFKIGEHVFGTCIENNHSAFAEYVVTDESLLAKKPNKLTFDQAASCVMSGITALVTIRDGAKIVKNESEILINGASGSIGTFAIQIAKHVYNAKTVTAVCRNNIQLVQSLGADHVIDYTKEDYTNLSSTTNNNRPMKYDVILDNVLNHSYKESKNALKENGIIIPNSVGLDRSNWFGAIPMFIFKPSNYPAIDCIVNRTNLQQVAAMIENGRIKPIIDKVYTLNETPQAVAYMANRHARGQVIIHVADDYNYDEQ